MENKIYSTQILIKFKEAFLRQHLKVLREVLEDNNASTKIFVYRNLLAQEMIESEINILLRKIVNNDYKDKKDDLLKELIVYLMAYSPVIEKKEKTL